MPYVYPALVTKGSNVPLRNDTLKLPCSYFDGNWKSTRPIIDRPCSSRLIRGDFSPPRERHPSFEVRNPIAQQVPFFFSFSRHESYFLPPPPGVTVIDDRYRITWKFNIVTLCRREGDRWTEAATRRWIDSIRFAIPPQTSRTSCVRLSFTSER